MDLASPSKRLPSHRISKDAPLMGFVLVCAPPPTYLLPVHSPMLLPAPFGSITAR